MTVDPFDTLGVEPRFDLDLDSLEQRHRTLSGTLHPDRYAGRPATERRLALDKAIAVNDAWRALRDPLRRAESLLGRFGVVVSETGQPAPPPALLMEMMEVGEELDAARRAADGGRIGQIGEHMHHKEQELLARLERGFLDADGDPGRLAALLPLLGELRYVRRVFDELEAAEEQLCD
jgi:molecular chaperone HscB